MTLSEIQEIVAHAFGVQPYQMMKTRREPIASARMTAMYLARQVGFTQARIGKFWHRVPSATGHAELAIRNRMATDRREKVRVLTLLRLIKRTK